MSAKPTLSVRPPKNIEDFVSGGSSAANSQRPAAESQAQVLEFQQQPADSTLAPAIQSSTAPRSAPSVSTEVSGPRTKIRGVVQRADGVERARVTVYLSVPAAAKLRRHCFENGLDLSDVAALALEEAIDRIS